MAFDFKKEYREFYLPKAKPELVTVPRMNYLAVRGAGDPNEEGGAYKASIGLLYGVAYTIKMSKLGDHRIEGYFDFVVPPLEGFWWQEDLEGFDYRRKEDLEGFDYRRKEEFHWISVLRLPDFVTEEDLNWAKAEAERKKKQDFTPVEFLSLEEGLCVQMLHVGPFDLEPESVAKMDAYLEERGYENDVSPTRLHHEIYLSDVRKLPPERWKTVIRHPIRKR